MIIPDRVDQGVTGAAAAQVNIGNYIIAEWATNVLGARPVVNPTVLTTAEHTPWTWQMQSNELKGLQPVDFPGQPHGDATATNSNVEGIYHPYFALNIPAYGGETVAFYVTMEQAASGNGQAYCTVWYGQEGDQMPSSYDPLPGVQRYGVMGAITACGAAGARAGPAAFNVVGGEAITEVYGTLGGTTWAAAEAKDGIWELNSSGFASSPLRYGSAGSAAPALGAGMFYGHVEMTKESVYVPIDRYTVIDSYFDNNPSAVNTDYWMAGVQFIRPGE